jgi:murein DD-endopeptidase MepM/ murein hydrolase activator NlpD
MVKRQLAAQGLPNDAAAVQRGVAAVAAANGLDNPNRIFPGQSLDLGVLSTGASAPPAGGQGGPAPIPRRVGLSEWLGIREPAATGTPAAPRAGGPVLDGAATLSSGYGMRSDPFTGAPAFHAGVDLAASPGTPIRPMRDGIVVFSGWQRGYGRTIIVRHGDGLESVYAHNQKNQVRVGDAVTRETQLGEVGSTGRSTGPHLHFEVRKHGSPVNPMPYLQTEQLARAS